jgi:molybdopterin converting factor small subunit
MIKVHITTPFFWSRDHLDERGWIEMNEGARLSDALKEIKMPVVVARMLFICINGALCTSDVELVDGDCIAFFPIPSGG